MGAWFGHSLNYTQENITKHGIYLELITRHEKEDTDKIRR